MQITFEQIFKHSDVLNPVSQTTLLLAGKLAQMNSNKTLLDLGSGKGYPSLLLASVFGVNVNGVDFNKAFVDYANSRARLLNLTSKAEYLCQDLKGFTTDKKYDIVAALGFDVSIYGGRTQALNCFNSMLKSGGVIILTEPVWTRKPVPPKILKALNVTQEIFTLQEMQRLLAQQGFKEVWHAISTKTDWEIYVRPIFVTMQDFIKNNPDREQDAQAVIDGFKAEYDAACRHWNVALWVLKPT
jgi:cyclopropane fatty-acyl-phospholipid synthase-like methyltransferase